MTNKIKQLFQQATWVRNLNSAARSSKGIHLCFCKIILGIKTISTKTCTQKQEASVPSNCDLHMLARLLLKHYQVLPKILFISNVPIYHKANKLTIKSYWNSNCNFSHSLTSTVKTLFFKGKSPR